MLRAILTIYVVHLFYSHPLTAINYMIELRQHCSSSIKSAVLKVCMHSEILELKLHFHENTQCAYYLFRNEFRVSLNRLISHDWTLNFEQTCASIYDLNGTRGISNADIDLALLIFSSFQLVREYRS